MTNRRSKPKRMSSKRPFPVLRDEQSKQLVFPFLVYGALWLLLGSLIVAVIESQTPDGLPYSGGSTLGAESLVVSALIWMAGVWLLAMVDLFSTGAFIQAVLRLSEVYGQTGSEQEGFSSSRSSSTKGLWIFRAIFWGTQKLVCLAAWVMVLMRGQVAPRWSVVMGISTLVVVPLLAGLSWWRKQSQENESAY